MLKVSIVFKRLGIHSICIAVISAIIYQTGYGENVARGDANPDEITSISRTMTYQGMLTDADGNPISEQSRTINFRLFDSLTGGSELWNQATLVTTDINGYFGANLNNLNLPFDKDYFLELQIQGEQPMTPRQMMGMSGFAARADTSQYAENGVGGSGGGWVDDGDVIRLQDSTDRVGIGTSNPAGDLSIHDDDNQASLTICGASDEGLTYSAVYLSAPESLHSGWILAHKAMIGSYYEDSFQIVKIDDGSAIIPMTIQPSGHVIFDAPAITQRGTDFCMRAGEDRGDGGRALVHGWNDQLIINFEGDFAGETRVMGSKLLVDGRTVTSALEITGGADIAEPFPITQSNKLRPGSVVIIDEDNPGRLTLSNIAYDRRVAGIISGAGGVNPGLTLSQQDMVDGDQNVALSGRVYALATTANGAIRPGDLLTTSEIPGHVMKVTEFDRAHGTVIGKAMSAFEKGNGLVLVLVNLQ